LKLHFKRTNKYCWKMEHPQKDLSSIGIGGEIFKATGAKGIGAKSQDKEKPKCVEECRPGRGSLCHLHSGKRRMNSFSCVEVYELLKKAGVDDPENVSSCVKASIMAGYIKMTGSEEDLKQTVVRGTFGDWSCGHEVNVTLEQLLYQPDYAGLDYEDGLQDATVICDKHKDDEEAKNKGKEKSEFEEGRTYVTRVCEGFPELDCGKFHNHCTECPGFGECIYDYRNAHCWDCGEHYFSGMTGFRCQCQGGGREGDSDGDTDRAPCVTS